MNQQQAGAQPPTGAGMNHGGHEMFDLHETLAGIINVLDQFMMFRQYVQDKELVSLLERQYDFILQQYNTVVEAFQTGQKPTVETQTYMMTQSNEVVYGLTPSQPKKPNQSLADISDQGITGHMLGLIKSMASFHAMTAVEVTNPVVRRVLADSVPNYVEMAYEIFLYQNKHGYYQVPQLTTNDTYSMLNAFAPAKNKPQMPMNQIKH
ncbi:spore coat protein [Pontibacillus halophilus]|nr:spore coat protein [Pontibacillus halophilus]